VGAKITITVKDNGDVERSFEGSRGDITFGASILLADIVKDGIAPKEFLNDLPTIVQALLEELERQAQENQNDN
jgi:hypothetical protein